MNLSASPFSDRCSAESSTCTRRASLTGTWSSKTSCLTKIWTSRLSTSGLLPLSPTRKVTFCIAVVLAHHATCHRRSLLRIHTLVLPWTFSPSVSSSSLCVRATCPSLRPAKMTGGISTLPRVVIVPSTSGKFTKLISQASLVRSSRSSSKACLPLTHKNDQALLRS